MCFINVSDYLFKQWFYPIHGYILQEFLVCQISPISKEFPVLMILPVKKPCFFRSYLPKCNLFPFNNYILSISGVEPSETVVTGKINNYLCSECGQQCRTPYRLKVHSRVHSGVKPYTCEICDHKFAQKCHLYRHYRRRHKGGTSNYIEDFTCVLMYYWIYQRASLPFYLYSPTC